MSPVWTVLALVVGLLWFYKRWRNIGKTPPPDMPGPKGYPILGHLQLFSKNMDSITKDFLPLAEQFPQMYKSENLLMTVYFISDAELVKKMTTERAHDFINRISTGSDDSLVTNKSLIGIKDDVWRHRRKQMSAHFSISKISALIADVFVVHAQQLMTQLSKLKPDEEIDLQTYFSRLTLDVIGDAGFGMEFNSQTNPGNYISTNINKWLDSFAIMGTLVFFPFWDKLPFKIIKEFLSGQELLKDICYKALEERAKATDKGNFLLQTLSDLMRSGELAEREVLGEAVLLLLAGNETTGSTLAWMTYMISQYPEVERKVVEEIDRELGDTLPDQTNIHKLRYLDNVFHETLRFHPPTILTSRENTKDETFNGYLFPAGSQFLVSIWGLHHDPRYWKEPFKFDPDRWEPENAVNHVPGAYMPFGSGPRMCLGHRFATLQIKSVLAVLFKRFKVLCKTTEPKVKPGMTWRLESLPVRLVKRN